MNQPEKTFQHGTCRAAIFANKSIIKGKEVVIRKAVIAKRYKDRDGTWKNSNSLDTNDIPKMIAALTTAYHYLTQSKTNGYPETEEEAVN